ncbi:30S ribosomal protein S6 [bacterium]|nr:30S ribosomal protein S6 [bacterium]MBU1600126.1 30S ribosomal protein S6 [bacterium]
MNFYDLLIVFDIGGKKREKVLKGIKSAISEKGGAIEKVEEWGARRLAYPIKKKQDGFYLILKFTAPPETIKVIEDLLRREEEVLRFLATGRKEAVPEEAEEPKEEKATAEKEEKDEGVFKGDNYGESDQGS